MRGRSRAGSLLLLVLRTLGLLTGGSAVGVVALAGVPSAPIVLRGPYLQQGAHSGMIVRWRTDQPTEARVRYGPAPDDLSSEVALLNDPRLDHELAIENLAPDTRYYYAVGTRDEDLAGGDADHFFATSPLPMTRRPIRIWAIGDSGECSATPQGCIDAAAVRDADLGFAAPEIADVWIMLGDNAYGTGSDSEYTEGLFEVYPSVLRNTVPTRARHGRRRPRSRRRWPL